MLSCIPPTWLLVDYYYSIERFHERIAQSVLFLPVDLSMRALIFPNMHAADVGFTSANVIPIIKLRDIVKGTTTAVPVVFYSILVPCAREILVSATRINVTATLLECGRTPQR